MPSWKKVITSGSNAELNQITASAFQFVGSGTAELEVQGHITASGNISASGTDGHSFGGNTLFDNQIVVGGHLTANGNIFGDGATNISSINHITASGNISASGEYLGNQIQIYNSNFQDDMSTTTHYVPIGTNNFEQTTEDADEVGFVAPYDGELVKIIYRHNFDASSTTTRWTYTVIPDGTDLAGTPTTRFRASITGATTDTIKEVTVADADGASLDDMFFNKGETIFLSIRNSADVTTTAAEFHVTVVLKFNIPLGLI